jgi:hypothetical protein
VEAALGLRIKSGRAIAVLLGGPDPRVLETRELQLCDPEVPESRQPFHSLLDLPERNPAMTEDYLRGVVEDATRASFDWAFEAWSAQGHQPAVAGFVVGSVGDPGRIAGTHIRAHALEGRLFWQVCEAELGRRGVPLHTVLVETDAYRRAAEQLRVPEAEVRTIVGRLGRDLEGRWGADQKTAALAALVASVMGS